MKNRVQRKIMSLLLALAMLLSLVPTGLTAYAASAVSYLAYDAESGEFSTASCTDYETFTGQRTWGAEGETKWYVADSNFTYNTPSTWGDTMYYFNVYGDVHLIIKDNVKIHIGAYGIKINNGGSLTVYAQSTGSNMGELYSNGTQGEGEYFGRATGNPGIDANGATFTINGGRVTGQAGRNRVGIDCGGGGLLTVNGGEVTAYSRMGNLYTGPGQPEAIGGVNSNFVLNGGHVYAQNGDNDNWGYCIGCAPNYGYGNITVNGGDLEAYAISNHGKAFGGSLKVADDLYMKAGNIVEEMKLVGGYGGQAKVRIRNLIPVTGLSIASTLNLNVSGDSSTLTPVFTPSDATFNEGRYVTWESSDESIATVDANGKVTPGFIPPGQVATATITATANNGTPDDTSDDKKANCTVTLSVVDVSGVTVDYSNIEMKTNGYPAKLVPDLGPNNASYKSFHWSSNNESVATVDQNGIVTPGQVGTAVITYTADNGSPDDPSDDKTASCTVTVTKPAAVSYLEYNIDTDSFTQKSTEDYTTLIDSLDTITGYTAVSNNLAVLGEADEEHWYYVDHDLAFAGRMTVLGDVHLILKNGVTMKANVGIAVNSGNSLTVYSQSENAETAGKLTTGFGHYRDGYHYSLGTGGNITINGGKISASGGFGGRGMDGNITINGGDVTATPGDYWAVGMSGTITVNNGTVSAQGYHDRVNVYPAISGTLNTADKLVVLAENDENPTNPVRNPGGCWKVIIHEAISVADITAEPMELKVNGPTGTINTVFVPAEASYNTVDWLKFESDNTDVATVDNKGVVTPGVAGTANITITATNGTETTADDKTTVCEVIVRYVNVFGVTLDRETLGLTLNGPSDTLKATVLEEDASDKTVVWSSSDENIVKVNQKGVVTPVNLGTATITVTATNGTPDDTSDDKTATCTVNVTILDVEEITLDKTSVEMEANRATIKLSPTIAPQYATYRTADMITWSSDNPAVATVDQDGTVRGIWEGTATITATAINGTPDDPSDDKTATCTVTVSMVHITDPTISDSEIDLNLYRKPYRLSGTVNPSDASYKTYKWVSDDPEIATVDQGGSVTPVSAGTTTIRFIADNGSPEDTSDDKEATCTVNIFIPDEIRYLDYDSENGTLKEAKTTAYSPVYNDDTYWGAHGAEKWYYVDSDMTFSDSIAIRGDVHIVLADNATLTVEGGITLGTRSSLTVYAQSQDESTMGKLVATTISGDGSITINGGVVTSNAPTGKPGIDVNTVTVNGGKLSAKGDNEFHGTSGIVCTAFVINGGYVNAQGGTWDPGKGIAASETITVNGGTLDVSAQFVAYTGKLTVREDYIMVVSGNGFRDNTRIDVTKIEEETRIFQVARAHIGVPSDVTGVTLDKTSVELALGVDHVNLIPTVAPYDSRDNVVWSSSDESVATVDRNGEVVPVGVGNAVITATATNGTEDTSDDKTTTCEVTVYSKDGVSYLKYDSETRSFTEEYAANYRTISKDLREWESEYDWDDSRHNDPVWLYADQDVTYDQYDDIYVYGNINLIIKDGVTITIPNHIYVGSGKLTIYAQSQDEATMGKLIIKNETFSNAGIDIKYSDTSLTINGGYIETHGNEGGAGIGGGKYSDTESTIIINGGIVKAYGGEYAAGIGGGGNYDASDWDHGGNGGNVVINGGTVIAVAGGHGAKAIGGGIADNGNLPETDGTLKMKGMLVDAGDSEDTAVRVTDYPANVNYNYVFIRPDPDYSWSNAIKTSAENGTVTVTKNGKNVTTASEGDVITVKVEPDAGYKLSSISAVVSDSFEQTLDLITVMTGREYKFVMPAKEVMVKAIFEEGVQDYDVKTTGDENGTLIATKDGETITSAVAGDTVTINVQPGEGYRLETIKAGVDVNLDIKTSQDVIDLLRDANIQGIEMGGDDFTDLTFKANANGDLAVMRGDETVLTMPKNLDVGSQQNNGKIFYIFSDSNYWSIGTKDGKVVSVLVVDMESNTPTFYSSSDSGLYTFAQGVDLITVKEGKEYSFVMPDLAVNVQATFERDINTKTITWDVEDFYFDHNSGEFTLDGITAVANNSNGGGIAVGNGVIGFRDEDQEKSICFRSSVGKFVEINFIFGEPYSVFGGVPEEWEPRRVGNTYMLTWTGEADEVVFRARRIGGMDSEYYIALESIEFIILDESADTHEHSEATLEHIAAKAATCTEAGNTEYYYCSECGKYFTDANGENEITEAETVVNALDHDYKFASIIWDGFTAKAKYVCDHDETHVEYYDAEVTNEVTTAVSCVADGVRTYTASYDGHTDTKTETIKAVGHHNYVAVVTEPTETEGGYTTYTCSECGDSYVADYTEIKHLYTITWKNDDGSILETDTGVEAGATPSYDGETPVKAADAQYTYTFAGWSPEVSAVTGDVTYTATFEKSALANDELKFASASLTLQNNLKVNFAVKKDLIDKNGYENLHAVFTMNGDEITVSNYTVNGDYYVFSFSNIAPHKMNDTITATLHATRGGEEFVSDELEYSVAEYCYSMLSRETTGDKLRTLLVDLLHYGSSSQIYADYHTDALVDASLTAEQLAWGTAADPELTSVTNAKYATVDNPSVKWAGASLNLNESIIMQFVFTAESAEGVTVKIEDGSGTLLKEIAPAEFATSGSYYIAKFKGLTAGQMRDTVYVTAYRDGVAVSNTVAYSIESYAYAKQNDDNANLANLVKAMMKYGNSAYAYAH